MKKGLLALLLGVSFMCVSLRAAPLYAGNGDLIVDGNLGVGTLNPVGHVPSRKGLIVAGTTTDALVEAWGTLGAKALLQSVGGNSYLGNLTKGSGTGSAHVVYGDGTIGMTLLGTNGNLGIGTISPEMPLHIRKQNSAISLDSTGSGSVKWWLYPTDAANGQGPGKLLFYRPGVDGLGSSMTIDGNNGNVGIGTVSPVARLSVFDSGTFNPASTGLKTLTFGDIVANSWRATGMCSGNSQGGNKVCLGANDGKWFFGYQADANTMNITAYIGSGGDLYLRGNMYALQNFSDVSLKKEIETMPETIKKLAALRGVYYKLKDEKRATGRQVGVIAQELETVFPELVQTVDNPLCMNQTTACEQPKVKAVDYPKLAVVALQGVKELSEKVEQLESRLLKLEQSMSQK